MKLIPSHTSRTVVRALACVVAFGCTILAATPVQAQGQGTTTQQSSKGKELTPPVPAPPRTPPSHLMGSAMAFLLGALIIGVNFIPSKRGHQD